jgi:hypothetical protein
MKIRQGRVSAKMGMERLIGTLGEKSLHSGLKEWYARPGDSLEKMVHGFHIDIVRGDLLIEIQTGNFSSIKYKLNTLAERHPVRLVFPISTEKWIVSLAADGKKRLRRRKSPRKGSLYHLFDELIYIPELVRKRDFSLEVLLIHEEEVRRNDGRGSRWRKGWSIADRCLMNVVSRHVFDNPADFFSLIPENLQNPFSTHDLAGSTGQPLWLAQKMAYCLRRMGAVKVVGKNGNSRLYSIIPAVKDRMHPS